MESMITTPVVIPAGAELIASWTILPKICKNCRFFEPIPPVDPGEDAGGKCVVASTDKGIAVYPKSRMIAYNGGDADAWLWVESGHTCGMVKLVTDNGLGIGVG